MSAQLFEQALVAKLNSIAELTALLGTDSGSPAIFTQAVPQTHNLGANGPALSYTVPTKPFGNVLTGSDGTATARVQIDAWSYTYSTSKAIIGAIRLAMAVPSGTWGDGSCVIMSVVVPDSLDLPEQPRAGSDQWIYHVVQELHVKYRVPLPSGS